LLYLDVFCEVHKAMTPLSKKDIVEPLLDEHEECYGFDYVTITKNKVRIELANKVADELERIRKMQSADKEKHLYQLIELLRNAEEGKKI